MSATSKLKEYRPSAPWAEATRRRSSFSSINSLAVALPTPSPSSTRDPDPSSSCHLVRPASSCSRSTGARRRCDARFSADPCPPSSPLPAALGSPLVQRLPPALPRARRRAASRPLPLQPLYRRPRPSRRPRRQRRRLPAPPRRPPPPPRTRSSRSRPASRRNPPSPPRTPSTVWLKRPDSSASGLQAGLGRASLRSRRSASIRSPSRPVRAS